MVENRERSVAGFNEVDSVANDDVAIMHKPTTSSLLGALRGLLARIRPKCVLPEVLCVFIATFLLSSNGSAQEQDLPISSPWHPTMVGASWTYKTTSPRFREVNGEMRPFYHTFQEIHEITGISSAGGRTLAQIRKSGDDISPTNSLISVTDQNISMVYDGRTDTPIAWLPMVPQKRTTIYTENGSDYEGTWTVRAEKVRVPAGEFDAMAVTKLSIGIKSKSLQEETRWFVSNIGVVKRVSRQGRNDDDLRKSEVYTHELVRFVDRNERRKELQLQIVELEKQLLRAEANDEENRKTNRNNEKRLEDLNRERRETIARRSKGVGGFLADTTALALIENQIRDLRLADRPTDNARRVQLQILELRQQLIRFED